MLLHRRVVVAVQVDRRDVSPGHRRRPAGPGSTPSRARRSPPPAGSMLGLRERQRRDSVGLGRGPARGARTPRPTLGGQRQPARRVALADLHLARPARSHPRRSSGTSPRRTPDRRRTFRSSARAARARSPTPRRPRSGPWKVRVMTRVWRSPSRSIRPVGVMLIRGPRSKRSAASIRMGCSCGLLSGGAGGADVRRSRDARRTSVSRASSALVDSRPAGAAVSRPSRARHRSQGAGRRGRSDVRGRRSVALTRPGLGQHPQVPADRPAARSGGGRRGPPPEPARRPVPRAAHGGPGRRVLRTRPRPNGNRLLTIPPAHGRFGRTGPAA